MPPRPVPSNGIFPGSGKERESDFPARYTGGEEIADGFLLLGIDQDDEERLRAVDGVVGTLAWRGEYGLQLRQLDVPPDERSRHYVWRQYQNLASATSHQARLLVLWSSYGAADCDVHADDAERLN